MASKDRFEAWPKDVQATVMEAAEEAVKETNSENEVHEEEYEKIVKEKGMEIYEVDREPLMPFVESVYDNWRDQYGAEMINKIQELGE